MSGSTITASAARFLMLPQAVLAPETVLRWPTKAPAAVGTYTLDITPWLDDITDTLASFTAVVNSGNAAGLAIQGQQITGASNTGMTVTLAGGVTGNEYSSTFTATSTGGAVDSWTVWLYVQNIGATLARQQPTTIGPAGQGFNYRGVWQPDTDYNPYDVLTYGASVYECSEAFTSGATFSSSPLNLWLTTGEDITQLGEELTALPAAAAAADADTFPVAQAGATSLLQQSMLAVWTYMAAKLLTRLEPVLEITADTQLTAETHNGCVLVCSAPVQFTVGNFSDLGSGFACYIINLSTGNVTMGTGITGGGLTPTITPGAAANLNALSYSGGNVVFYPGVAFTIPTPAITVNNPGTHPASTGFTVTGTIANDTTAALDYSVNGGSTWTAAVSPTISGSNFSFVISSGFAAGEYQMMVRDHNNTSVSGTSTTFIIGTNTLTVSGGSTGTAGSALTISGSVVPAGDAVQIALSTSNSTAPTTGWIAATNASGTLSGSLTPSTSGTYYVWAKDTVSGLTVVSSAITVSTTGSIAITSAPTTGTAGTALTTITGTVGPSGTAVQVQLGASATVAPTGSWTAATVSGTGWTATLTPASAGTFYIWAEQTATPSVQAVSAAVTVAAGSSGITMSLLSGSGNGGLVGDTFGPGTGSGAGAGWGSSSTISHTATIAPNLAYSGSGSGTVDHAIFWFDSSATNTTAPGSGTTTSVFNSGSSLAFNQTGEGGIAPPSTAGTYYGTYAVYNSSAVLLGVVKTAALTIT